MGAEKSRQISPRLKRQIFWEHSFGPAGGVVIAWSLYVADSVFGVDLIAILKNRGERPEFNPALLYLIAAIVATVICIVIAAVRMRKGWALARDGVEVTGTITSVGRIAMLGCVKVECRYSYQGQNHVFAWSHIKASKKLSEGDSATLIVDPTNPKHCMRKDEVYPESKYCS
jgi:hypothetical protein